MSPNLYNIIAVHAQALTMGTASLMISTISSHNHDFFSFVMRLQHENCLKVMMSLHGGAPAITATPPVTLTKKARRELVYRARPSSLLDSIHARGGSSKGHVWNAIN